MGERHPISDPDTPYQRIDPYNPYTFPDFPDPDEPTVPSLPACLAYHVPPRPERREGLAASVVNQFNRLSLGARMVLIGCLALLTFCLISPYVNPALGGTIDTGVASLPSAMQTPTPGGSQTASVDRTNQRTRAGAAVKVARTSSPLLPLSLTISCAQLDRSSGIGTLCVNTVPGARVRAMLTSCQPSWGEHAAASTIHVAGNADAKGSYTWTGQLANPTRWCFGDATALVTVTRGKESVSEQTTFGRRHN